MFNARGQGCNEHESSDPHRQHTDHGCGPDLPPAQGPQGNEGNEPAMVAVRHSVVPRYVVSVPHS